MSATTFDAARRLFAERGGSMYGGERVTQWEHAAQAACLAEADGAAAALVVAALLHDIGHLLHRLPDDAPDRGIDDAHERIGADWLAGHLPPDVVAPVRLHVPAKRYLCAVDPLYLEGLSVPSRVSLELQGGPLPEDQIAAFERLPFATEAVRLRRWDDAAKVPGLRVPPIEHFRPHFDALAAGASS